MNGLWVQQDHKQTPHLFTTPVFILIFLILSFVEAIVQTGGGSKFKVLRACLPHVIANIVCKYSIMHAYRILAVDSDLAYLD